MEAYIGEGKALDPDKYFIVCPNQIGNGLSTSPFNIRDNSISKERFPKISIADDVKAQYTLISELFGVTEIALTFEWVVRYPDMVKRAAPIGATAKASPHNSIFIEVVMSCLQNDPLYNMVSIKVLKI